MNGNLPPSVMTDYLKRQGVKGLLDMKCQYPNPRFEFYLSSSWVGDGTANLLARCCVRNLAVLSVRSTLAAFEIKPSSNSFCIPSFRKPDNVPASLYEGMSWNPKSPGLLQWGKRKKQKRLGEQDEDENEQHNHERPTVEKSTPFVASLFPDSVPLITRRYCSLLIVNDGSPVTFELTHDALENQKKYFYAHAKVASVSVSVSSKSARIISFFSLSLDRHLL
jgi:hypothetical protein